MPVRLKPKVKAARLAERLVRTLAADVDLKKAFGHADLKEQLDGIRADYAALRARTRTDAEKQDLSGLEARDIRQVEAFRDMARGTFQTSGGRPDWQPFTHLAEDWGRLAAREGTGLPSLSEMVGEVSQAGIRGFM